MYFVAVGSRFSRLLSYSYFSTCCVQTDVIAFCSANVYVLLFKLESVFGSCRSTSLLYSYVVILVGLLIEICNRLP